MFKTKAAAEQAEREALSAHDRGISLAPREATLEKLFDQFIKAAVSRKLSGTTIYGYRAAWKRCEPISSVRVDRLRPAHLAEFYAQLSTRAHLGARPLSARSIQHTHATLKAVLAWAVRLELASRNVAAYVDPPSGSRKHARAFTGDDALRIIKEAEHTPYRNMVTVAFATGLRRGELAALRWDDVDFDRCVATIRGSIAQLPGHVWLKAPKSNRTATIALSHTAVQALRAQRVQQKQEQLQAHGAYEVSGYVFTKADGQRQTPGAIGQAVRRIVRNAGVPQGALHAMRHSTGSWLIREGVDVRTVAAVLRHSSAATTLNVYAHEIEGAQADAVSRLEDRLTAAGCNHPATTELRRGRKAL